MPRFLRDAPIRRKLLLAIFLTSLTAVLLLRGTFFVFETVTFREATMRQFATLGKIIAANSTAALAFRNAEDAAETLSALKAEPLVVYACLYDGQGKLFAAYPAERAAGSVPAAPGPDGFRFSGMQLEGFQPVVQQDKRLGTLCLRIDTTAIMLRWVRLSVVVAAVVIAVILAVTFGFSQVLQRQISRPILALAETARAISERHDYSVRAVKLSTDEIGLLTDAFNQMLKEIDAQKTALDEHAIVAITNPQGRITYVNDKFCAISKYSRAELLGQDHRIINSGHHPKEFIRGLWTTIAQGRVWQGEICNRAKDGSIYWVATTIVPFLKADGKPYQYVAIRADITAQKLAQEEVQMLNRTLEARVAERTAQLEAANAELVHSRAELKNLFETIDEGYCIIEVLFDAEGRAHDYRFLSVNPAFEKHSGLIGAQGRCMRELAPAHEAHWFETYGRIALTGQPARFENYAEQLHRWFDVYACRYGDPANRQVAILFSNITERKMGEELIRRLNTDLQQRASQLEASNKELEAFCYSVSHDLRAPLRHIDGFASMLNTQTASRLDDTGRRYLRTICDAAKKMGALIDDLLAFSRLGRALMNRGPVPLDGLFAEVKQSLEPEMSGRVIDWRIGPLPVVDGDLSMLRQVVGNLLGNAVKYTRKRDKAVIEIGICENGREVPEGQVTLYIRDNGAGFEMKYISKLFGVFQRLHAESDFEGTGVGLALVRRIVERHGGSVWAEGQVNVGACFYLNLPLYQPIKKP